MKQLINNLLAIDKLKHFFIGFWIAFLSIVFLTVIDQSLWISIIINAIIAAAKEYYDKKTGKGTFEVFDFIYTVVPAVVLYVVILID